MRVNEGVSFGKTPRQLNFMHATCYTASRDVVDFKRAPNFGEAQPNQVLSPMARRNINRQ